MRLERILTDRHYQTWPSWQILYEWEDELAKSLDIPITNSPKIGGFLYRKFRSADNKFCRGNIHHFLYGKYRIQPGYSLYFEMYAKYHRDFSNTKRTIPIIVDFWDKSDNNIFEKMYSACPYLLITSFEVFSYLHEKNVSTNKLIHFPFSLPSIYKLDQDQVFEKKYDVVLAGRKNPVLFDYLKRYETEHPEIEYLYQVSTDGGLSYCSNKKGIVKEVNTREEYMNLIRSSKVAFYATPGIDGGENRTNGFNPVTPRFLELLSAGCHIIARYPKNADTDFFQMKHVCPSITSYDAFNKQMSIALDTPSPVKRNAEYLEDHYTSKRIEILERMK